MNASTEISLYNKAIVNNTFYQELPQNPDTLLVFNKTSIIEECILEELEFYHASELDELVFYLLIKLNLLHT